MISSPEKKIQCNRKTQILNRDFVILSSENGIIIQEKKKET